MWTVAYRRTDPGPSVWKPIRSHVSQCTARDRTKALSMRFWTIPGFSANIWLHIQMNILATSIAHTLLEAPFCYWHILELLLELVLIFALAFGCITVCGEKVYLLKTRYSFVRDPPSDAQCMQTQDPTECTDNGHIYRICVMHFCWKCDHYLPS